MNNWTEVSEKNLSHNLHVLQQAAGLATEVLAVIKADAYGHGATRCAPMLVRAGARWLGVTCAGEGARVRPLVPPETDILIMCGFLPADVPLILNHRLTPVVWTPGQITWLGPQPGLRIHVEVDTGMGRQGVRPGQDLTTLLSLIAANGFILDGLFTHLCSSEQAHSTLTTTQMQRFAEAVAQVKQAGLHPTWVHAGNSSALDNPPATQPRLIDLAASVGARPMVRTGLALYGYNLPIEGDAPPQTRPLLRPALTWKAHILSTRTLAPGDTVGYNATFTAPHPMRIALLPVGYADGLRRELSGPRGWVIFDTHKAPILGRISMNLTVVDITHIPNIHPGAESILLGPGITADDHAHLASTIVYEILCGIHPCT